MIRLVMGIIFILAAALNMCRLTNMQNKLNFGLSLCVFFIGLSTLLDDPLKKLDRKLSLSQILAFVLVALSIASLILIPMMNDSKLLADTMGAIDDHTFLLLGMGFSLLSLYVSDVNTEQVRRKIANEKLDAANQAKQQVLNRLGESVKRKDTKK